jgi:GH15 family glucan-1,4-alpha-glucosidase
MSSARQAPPIGDYGLIGDCHCSALVSRAASIDWCCMPRLDSGSCFARLLDWERGGFCSVSLADGGEPASCSYVKDTLVLQTTLRGREGEVKVTDFFAMREHGAEDPRRELIRIVECLRGTAEVRLEVAPRFDYGAVRPWLRRSGPQALTAIGGDDGLLIWCDGEPEIQGDAVIAEAALRGGEAVRLLMRFVRPHRLQRGDRDVPDAGELDERLEETVGWWRRWREKLRIDADSGERESLVRSALTLKAMTYAPTGAIAAAPTTSLPEVLGGERNWDYRFSWVRDSTLAAYALAELGCVSEAKSFRHFIVRSSGGHADDLQILFGVGGERRVDELELDLAGYRGSRPVRVGNRAANQVQLDAFGEILNLAWSWHLRGRSPDDDEWRFFAELVEAAIARWQETDRGIWEWRGEPQHFVHSKASCWAAVDRGLRLAEECTRRAPLHRWRQAREEIREAIESRGYDRERGVFVQRFDDAALDGALLLLPMVGFVAFDDERMVRTADAVREELASGGLLRRYLNDGLPGKEGAFVPCTFWLAECYARQGRLAQAREAFDAAMSAAGPLGLFSEEFDPERRELLGNYPQTLSHLSHVAATLALLEAGAHARDGVV